MNGIPGRHKFNRCPEIPKQRPRSGWANTMTITEEINTLQTAQKWLQPFRDLLDEIYFPDYAEYLAEENPEEFNRQYFYFLAQYS